MAGKAASSARAWLAGARQDQKLGLAPLPPARVDHVVRLTVGEPARPPTGPAWRWPSRCTRAADLGGAPVQPHRVRRFKLSLDPPFATNFSNSRKILDRLMVREIMASRQQLSFFCLR
jgi:hypothetical protein